MSEKRQLNDLDALKDHYLRGEITKGQYETFRESITRPAAPGDWLVFAGFGTLSTVCHYVVGIGTLKVRDDDRRIEL